MNSGLKFKALKLRLRGNTYSMINKKLHIVIPKSTLSTWFKSIKLPKTSRLKLKRQTDSILESSQEKGLKSLYMSRQTNLLRILDANKPFTKNINLTNQKLLLSILYLAEGAKYKWTRDLRLTNSNPKVIKFYLKLLNNCYALDTSKMRLLVQCRNDQNTTELEKYWQDIVNIPSIKLYPTYIDSRSKGKPTNQKNYKGVCTIFYFDTKIQLELEILSNLTISAILNEKIIPKNFVSQWLKPLTNAKM